MSYQFAVNVRSSEFIANKHDDSDSAEDDHLYLARPPTVSCYGLPYLDHTYGAPWPPSPPPPVPAAPAPLPRINGHIDIDNVSYHAEVCTTSDDPDNQYVDSITRCICGFLHDDGYMICCDKCGVWQHVDCMGVEREHIPEVYLCEVCQPRYVDRRKAMLIQRKRYELLTAVDVEAVDMSDDSNPLPLARDFNNLVPLRSGPKPQQKRFKVLKRRLSIMSGLKPLHRHSKFHRLPRKPLVNSPSVTTKVNLSPRLTSSKCVTDDLTDDYYHGGRRKRDDEVDVVELPGHRNTYSSEVAGLLRRQQRQNGQQQHMPHSVGDMLVPLRDQLCRVMHVGPNMKGLQVLDDVETSRSLIEYTGSVRVDDDAADDSVSPKRLHPFVLIYSKFESTPLRIESGATDSDAKYVRRSCKPNAEIRHVCDNSCLRFFIFSSRPIFRGQEITIPFDMEYTESDSFVCGCGRVPCPVLKSTAKFSRLGRRRKSERESCDANVDLNSDDMKPVTTGVLGRRRQREDSCHDNGADVRLSASDGAVFILAAAVNKRRGSDEGLTSSSRASLAARRRKRSSCVQEEDTSEDEAVVNVEETGRRQSLGDRTRRLDRERRASGSDRVKLTSTDREDKKPKITLEHSVSCTSPKDGEDDGRKMSREERKLEAIMKAFERMEKQTVKRRDSVSKTDGPRTSDRVEVKAEFKEEVEDVKSSVRSKKDVDIRKPAAKKLIGRRCSWLTMKRDSRKSSNVSSQSSSTSLDGTPISASVPCTPVAAASDHYSVPFKFPKTKKAMMSEWLQEKATGFDGRQGGGADDYRRSLTVDTSEDDDLDKYVNYIQTPSRHADALKNVRRTSTSSSSSKGSPASLYILQQQAEFGAGSAKKRWLRQVMHEKCDGDNGLTNGPLSPGDNSSSLSTIGVAASSELVAPLKKRRMARESTSEEAATLLSLANSVPAMEYEQLEQSRTPSAGQVSLAEQLLALQAGVVSRDNDAMADVQASTSSAACSVDEKADGFRLLLEGIEQAAARERVNSMQASPPICTSALPVASPPIAYASTSSALPVDAASDEDLAVAAAVDEGQSADDGCSLSCDSSVVTATVHRCSNSERDLAEVCSFDESTGYASAEPLLHSTSDVPQWSVDSVVSSNVFSGYPVAGSSTVHLDGVEEAVSCSEDADHLSDLDPDCPVSSSRRFFTALSDYSNEAASIDGLSSRSVVRGNLLTFRQAATGSVDDADVSSSGGVSAAWPECSSAVSSSLACAPERKKVSLLEYRNRMRERSSSSCGSNVLLYSQSDSGTTSTAVAEMTPDAGVSESSSSATVRERRESADMRWSAEATAAERLREQCHGHQFLADRLHQDVSDDDVDSKPAVEADFDVNSASFPAFSASQHQVGFSDNLQPGVSVLTVYPRSTPSSGVQPATLPSLASSAPTTLPQPLTGDSGMSSEAMSAADQRMPVTTCLTVHTVPADHSLTNGQLYDDLSLSTTQALTNSGSDSTARTADQPPSFVLSYDQCAATSSSSHV